MIENYLDEIQRRVDRLNNLAEFSCPGLLADLWPEIAATHRPQTFGSAFSRAVTKRLIRDVYFLKVDRSPHMTIWQKVLPVEH